MVVAENSNIITDDIPELWTVNNPTGKLGLIGVDKLGDAVRFFDPVSFKEQKVIQHKNHHEVAISPDHKFAFLSEFGKFAAGKFIESGNHISVIDLERQEIINRISTGDFKGPHGMRFDGDGNLWVIFEETGELGCVDVATMTLRDTYQIGAESRRPPFIEITPDSQKVYVSCKEGDLIVFDVATRKVKCEIQVPNGTEGIALAPCGKRLYVVENVKQDLLEIDTSMDEISNTIPLKGAVLSDPKKSRLLRLRFSPDGKYLVSTNYSSGIIHIHDGLNPSDHILVPVAKGPQGIAFGADGEYTLISNHDCGLITRVHLATAKAVEWFQGGKGIEGLTFY